MLGVIGGMGPLATADFFGKLILATGAKRDEDNIPTPGEVQIGPPGL